MWKQEFRNVSRDPATGVLDGEFRFDQAFGEWYKFIASPRLLRIRLAGEQDTDALIRMWDLNDGMGPEAEWDWSGIRDSSPEAIAAMFEIASRVIDDDEFNKRLGLAEQKVSK